jgi:DNA-binding XRE family transcriptional regulator
MKPETIKQARTEAGLTQQQAGQLVHVDGRTWRKWEAGDRQMHPAFWDLFCRKIGKAD